MLDELRTRFRSRFLETARARIVRVRRYTDESNLASIADELHSLAGEAGILEFNDCTRLARLGEKSARAGEPRDCLETVNALERAIEEIAG